MAKAKKGRGRELSEEDSLMRIMGNITQELASTDVQRFYSQVTSLNGTMRTVTPDRFTQTTVCRMNTQTARTNSRLETQRKAQLTKLLSEMREKPEINPNSKKMAPNTAPLYTRVTELVLEKADEKRKAQHQVLMEQKRREQEECTFQPKTGHKPARTHDEFREQALSWLSKRNTELERMSQQKQQSELAELQEKPQLSTRTVKLAQRVRVRQRSREGSLTERLYADNTRKTAVTPEPSFRPVLNNKTLKLVKRQDRTPVHERLYSLSGHSSRSSSAERQRQPTPPTPELGDDRKYRINTSPGTAIREPANKVEYSHDLDFLWRTLGRPKSPAKKQ